MSENKKMERNFERKRLFEEFKYNKELEAIEDDVNNGKISLDDADELKEAAHNTFTKNMECINCRKKICEEFNRLNEIRIKKSEEPDAIKNDNVLKSINTEYTVDLVKENFTKKFTDEKSAYDKQLMMIDYELSKGVLSPDIAEKGKKDAYEFFKENVKNIKGRAKMSLNFIHLITLKFIDRDLSKGDITPEVADKLKEEENKKFNQFIEYIDNLS